MLTFHPRAGPNNDEKYNGRNKEDRKLPNPSIKQYYLNVVPSNQQGRLPNQRGTGVPQWHSSTMTMRKLKKLNGYARYLGSQWTIGIKETCIMVNKDMLSEHTTAVSRPLMEVLNKTNHQF